TAPCPAPAANRVIKFVTGNKHKLAEVRSFLAAAGSSVEVEAISFDLPEIQGGCAKEIVKAKCQEAIRILPPGTAILVEDTSLSFAAFEYRLPGPYVKWFLQAGDGRNNMCRMLDGFAATPAGRKARAECLFAFADGSGGEPIVIEGYCHGQIVEQPRGPPNFGWDCIFEPRGFDQTYAELDPATKNRISHRAVALGRVIEYIQTGTLSALPE
ncbi:Ham1 family protein, partial [Fonticula alba]